MRIPDADSGDQIVRIYADADPQHWIFFLPEREDQIFSINVRTTVIGQLNTCLLLPRSAWDELGPLAATGLVVTVCCWDGLTRGRIPGVLLLATTLFGSCLSHGLASSSSLVVSSFLDVRLFARCSFFFRSFSFLSWPENKVMIRSTRFTLLPGNFSSLDGTSWLRGGRLAGFGVANHAPHPTT
jgi:hypothetical protein